MLRATATICCGLLAGPGWLLPQSAPPPPKDGQPAPARDAPRPEWEHAFDVEGDVSLAVGETTVFVAAADRTLRAFAIADGTLRWSLPDVEASRLVAGGDAVVIVGAGMLTARAADDGRQRWTQPMPEGDVGLAFARDRLAVTSGAYARLLAPDGQVEASLAFPAPLRLTPELDDTRVAAAVEDGRIVIFERNAPAVPAWTSAPSLRPVQALALDGDRVFATLADGGLTAYAVQHGHFDVRPEWEFSLYRPTSGRPAVSDRTVFVATLDNALHAIDRRSGTRRWNRPLGGRPVGDTTVTGDRVIVPLADGSVAVINAGTGAGVARLAIPDLPEQLLAIDAVSGPVAAVVTVTAGTSGDNVLRFWRIDR